MIRLLGWSILVALLVANLASSEGVRRDCAGDAEQTDTGWEPDKPWLHRKEMPL